MDARRSLLHHVHGNTRLTHQHHRTMDEGADRQAARDHTDHLQHLHRVSCAHRDEDRPEERHERRRREAAQGHDV
jgi:hypothetical protein